MVHSDLSPQRPFRVIIVGAGLVGLSLSHSLQLANIDHVVLEKHDEIVSVHGAALFVFPAVARIFDQFGFLPQVLKSCVPVMNEYQRWPDGSVSHRNALMKELSRRFEIPTIVIDREMCIKHLYQNLPDKTYVQTRKRVERIEHTKTSIQVFLHDGTVEEGDIVIGADGVHSTVRSHMWDYANKHEPGAIPPSDKDAFFTDFRGIFGVSEGAKIPGLGAAEHHIISGHTTSKLCSTQPGRVYWALSYKDEYSRPPKRFRPTEEEKVEVAKRFRDVKYTEMVTFGDLFDTRTRSVILNIEEGILGKWHAGRIVLVGDSACKMTADLGMGANVAIESAVTLCNILHRELQYNRNQHLSMSELSSLFGEYQKKRYARSKAFMNISGAVTRMRSYQSLWARIYISYIEPRLQKVQQQKFIEGFARAPKLDYAPVLTINEDAVGWKSAAKKNKGLSRAKSLKYALLTLAISISLSYIAVFLP